MDIDRDRLDPRLAQLIEGLPDSPPARDLWPGIAARLRPERQGRLVLRWPTALAAGLALLGAGAALASLAAPGRSPVAPHVAQLSQPTPGPTVIPADFASATATLQAAIDELERSLAASSASLDPTTRLRMEGAIAALDAAISDAQLRAEEAPEDPRAARYLTRTMERKLAILQSVAALTHRS